MTQEIVLSSHSTSLHVFVENSDGVVTFGEEQHTIIFDTSDNTCINAAIITLTDEHRQINFPIPFSGNKTSERIRLDTFFSLIFNGDEPIQIVPTEAPQSGENKARVDMEIKIETNLNVAFDLKHPSLLHTASLLVENTYIPVSRELLIYGSDFFANLFNGNYNEKRSGIYEIKEVDLHAFWWFIGSYMSKKFDFMSVESALVALRFADRFGFLRVHTRIFPYLKKEKIKESLLHDTLTLCARFDDNEAKCIFKNCSNEADAFKLLHDCIPEMTGKSIQTALKALEKVVDQFKKKALIDSESSLLSEAVRDEDLGVVLVLYNEDDDIVQVKSFRVYEFSWGDRTFGMSNVWEQLPEEYNLVKVPDLKEEFRRENDDVQECKRTYRVMEMHAYISHDEYIDDDDADMSFDSDTS